jgi:hypothetical protein
MSDLAFAICPIYADASAMATTLYDATIDFTVPVRVIRLRHIDSLTSRINRFGARWALVTPGQTAPPNNGAASGQAARSTALDGQCVCQTMRTCPVTGATAPLGTEPAIPGRGDRIPVRRGSVVANRHAW